MSIVFENKVEQNSRNNKVGNKKVGNNKNKIKKLGCMASLEYRNHASIGAQYFY